MSSLSTVSVPSTPTCLMVRVSAAGMITDFSLERKSCSPIVATLVLESGLQAPIRWGYFLA